MVKMKMTEDILEKIKTAGFKDTNEFVKANLHYLSKDKQRLFYDIENLKRIFYQEKYSKRADSNYSQCPNYS